MAEEERLLKDLERAVPPAWRRQTPGEHRWPFALAILVMIALQLLLPARLAVGDRGVRPSVEVVIIFMLIAAHPGRRERSSKPLRMLALPLIAVASLGNAWSVAWLVHDITGGVHT